MQGHGFIQHSRRPILMRDSDEQPIFLRYILYYKKKTKEMPTALQPNQVLFSFTIVLIR